MRICQARDASDAVTREYFAEGEFLPGSPAQTYYYGPDQIGTVRRVFATASSAPAYAYDPYGNPLQATAPLTDFNYAGMFYNADSGLSLALFRAYDPNAGRWLSRDPIGEGTDPTGNLYAYVGGNPISHADQTGLAPGDKLFGLPKSFWNWYHRQCKQPGDPDLEKDEAQELYQQWLELGKPGPD